MPYLIKVRMASGSLHERCENCDDRIRRNLQPKPLVRLNPAKYRPKFLLPDKILGVL